MEYQLFAKQSSKGTKRTCKWMEFRRQKKIFWIRYHFFIDFITIFIYNFITNEKLALLMMTSFSHINFLFKIELYNFQVFFASRYIRYFLIYENCLYFRNFFNFFKFFLILFTMKEQIPSSIFYNPYPLTITA